MVPVAFGPAWRQTWSFTCIRGLPSLVGALGQVDGFEAEGLLVQRGGAAFAAPPPRRHVGELVISAERLAVLGLALLAEVPAAGLLAVEGVAHHELAELEEVRDAPRPFQALVHRTVTEHAHVLPELVAQGRDLGQGLLEA